MDKEIGMKSIEKIYFLVLTFCLVLLFVDIEAQTWTGSGTKADPYIIDTYQELVDLSNNGYYTMDGNVYFALGANIDCTGMGDWDIIDGTGSEYWGNHLDGRGYSIIGLDLDWDYTPTAGNSQQGMFYGIRWNVAAADTTEPIIKNIVFDGTLVGGTKSGPSSRIYDYQFGIIAGVITGVRKSYWGGAADEPIAHPALDSIVIKNTVYNGFKISQWDQANYGTVASYAVGGTYTRISVEDSIVITTEYLNKGLDGNYNGNAVGGIFGITYTGTVLKQSYFDGAITYTEGATGDAVIGGLIGKPYKKTHILDCYTKGTFSIVDNSSITTWLGGLYGWNDAVGESESPILEGCYVAVATSETPPNQVGLVYAVSDYAPLAHNVYTDNSLGLTDNYSMQLGSATPFQASGMADADIKKSYTEMTTQSTFEAAEGYPFDFTNIWLMDVYPSFKYMLASSSITIITPNDGSNQTYPFDVTWVANGVADSFYVNGNKVLTSVTGDSTYTISSGIMGTLPITVYSADSTVFDSITVNAYRQGDLSLDSAYAIGNSLYYKVKAAVVNDTVDFYLGNDTLTSGMIHAGSYPFGAGIIDTTFVFPKPGGFYTQSQTWYKIETTEDSVDNYTVKGLTYVGQVGGNQICWTANVSNPIEVLGILDLGCGWVSGISTDYTTTFLQIPISGEPTFYKTSNTCTSECRNSPDPTTCGCTWGRNSFIAVDTTGGGSTVETRLFGDEPLYQVTGSSITRNNRKYYIYNQKLYMDDVLNGVDSTVIYDLTSYYDNGDLISPSLYVFDYASSFTDTIYYDGTLDDELPARDYPLIVLYENDGFQRIYSFDAFGSPRTYSNVYSSTFLGDEKLNATRNYFRGIDPAFIREP